MHVDERFIWRLLAQLIVALRECQSRPRPILHRDIKPANVLLDEQRNIKLADFGLAKELRNHYGREVVLGWQAGGQAGRGTNQPGGSSSSSPPWLAGWQVA